MRRNSKKQRYSLFWQYWSWLYMSFPFPPETCCCPPVPPAVEQKRSSVLFNNELSTKKKFRLFLQIFSWYFQKPYSGLPNRVCGYNQSNSNSFSVDPAPQTFILLLHTFSLENFKNQLRKPFPKSCCFLWVSIPLSKDAKRLLLQNLPQTLKTGRSQVWNLMCLPGKPVPELYRGPSETRCWDSWKHTAKAPQITVKTS